MLHQFKAALQVCDQQNPVGPAMRAEAKRWPRRRSGGHPETIETWGRSSGPFDRRQESEREAPTRP